MLSGVLAGCSGRSDTPYPEALRYPARKDVLVKERPGGEPRTLPARVEIDKRVVYLGVPGHIDQSILAGIEKYGGKALDPNKVSAGDRKQLTEALEGAFGTPARPKVAVESSAVDDLKLDDVTLRRGSKHYRRHCLHCHGLAGDGRGPTGPWVSPHPRDYRSGLFKFLSTSPDMAGNKPRRADLVRTISKGIESTSMPAFGLLPEQEIEELASYVMHLSLRGEVEYNTLETLLEQGELEGGSIEAHVASRASGFLDQWAESDKSINKPAAYPDDLKDPARLSASISRGYKFFLTKAACIACHADFGRQPAYKFDSWGTLVRPANLTVGTYRGGRRPIDIYWRITKGISPSNMPGSPKELNGGEVWDVVNFVQALPYPGMLPEDVRQKIYGSSNAEPKKTEHAQLTR
jgi:mono/diheme cytochrome c family protein